MSEDVLKRMHSEAHPIKEWKNPDGSVVWVRELDFDQVEEPWARYQLRDGGSVRQRVTTLRIFAVFTKDANGGFVQMLTAHGDPQIMTETAQQVTYSS